MKKVIFFILIGIVLMAMIGPGTAGAKDIGYVMTGSTAPPTHTVQVYNPDFSLLPLSVHLSGSENYGQSFTVGSTAFTMGEIWILGDDFFTDTFEIQLFQLASGTGVYTEVSGNLFAESQMVALVADPTHQWVGFDVDNILLSASTPYAFRFIDGNGNPMDWDIGESFSGGDMIQNTPPDQFITGYNFAFAITTPEPPVMMIIFLGGFLCIVKRIRKRLVLRRPI